MANEFILTFGQTGVVALLGALGAFLFRRDFRLSWITQNFPGLFSLRTPGRFCLDDQTANGDD